MYNVCMYIYIYIYISMIGNGGGGGGGGGGGFSWFSIPRKVSLLCRGNAQVPSFPSQVPSVVANLLVPFWKGCVKSYRGGRERMGQESMDDNIYTFIYMYTYR
jgi:hypothetical protein